MGCILELSLLIAGIWLCTRQRLVLGVQEVRSPFTVFAGMILIVQLPIGFGAGFALGAAEGIKAARDGTDSSVAQARFIKKYWWLDLAVVGSASLLAGGVMLAGLHEPEFLPPPPDDPVGVADYRSWMAEKLPAHEHDFHAENETPRSRNRERVE